MGRTIPFLGSIRDGSVHRATPAILNGGFPFVQMARRVRITEDAARIAS